MQEWSLIMTLYSTESYEALGGDITPTHYDTESQYLVKAYDYNGGEAETVSELVPESQIAETVALIAAHGFIAISEKVRDAILN